MSSTTIWIIAPDATINLEVSVGIDGTFNWTAEVRASQRTQNKPFHRYAGYGITGAKRSGNAATPSAARDAAENVAAKLRDDLLLAYAQLAAQIEQDRHNISLADALWPDLPTPMM